MSSEIVRFVLFSRQRGKAAAGRNYAIAILAGMLFSVVCHDFVLQMPLSFPFKKICHFVYQTDNGLFGNWLLIVDFFNWLV